MAGIGSTSGGGGAGGSASGRAWSQRENCRHRPSSLLGSAVSVPVDTGAEIAGEAESAAVASVDVPEEESACSADGVSSGACALVVGLATATVLPKVSNVGRTARVATYRYGQKGFRVMAGIQSEILDAVKQRLSHPNPETIPAASRKTAESEALPRRISHPIGAPSGGRGSARPSSTRAHAWTAPRHARVVTQRLGACAENS